MRTCLLAIGCDHYSEMGALQGAEADARRVFHALTETNQSYQISNSCLLLSPTKSEVEEALRKIGTDKEPIEVLTLYFAGHGALASGSYYLCLRDSSSLFLSGTALSFAQWLVSLKEISPRYAYMVLDSCASGGGHNEIANLLNDPSVGRQNASTFSCFAAACADQYAHESSSGGAMTNELLKVLDGRTSTSSRRPELDLLDVGRAVAEHLASDIQKPISWGLNLFGPGKFCRNPRVIEPVESFHVPDLALDSPLAARIRGASEELWELHRTAGKGLDIERLRNVVEKVVSDSPAADAVAFIFGLSTALISRLRTRSEEWEVQEAYVAFACLLLRYVKDDATAASVAREFLTTGARLERELVRKLYDAIEADPHVLMNSQAPLADFFYLPLRVSKFLAWIAHGEEIADLVGVSEKEDLHFRRRLIGRLLSTYGSSLRAMCDVQGSYLYVWFHYARRFGFVEELEIVFGTVFSDYVAVRGKVARCNIEPEIAFKYCLARGKSVSTIDQKWIANPSQLLAVLFSAAIDNGLSDVVDPFLEQLDHLHFNVFFPADCRDLTTAVIGSGLNRGHCVGMDVWTCQDYQRVLSQEMLSYASEARRPENRLESALCVAASLLFPDRLPVFLSVGPAS